MTIIKHNRLQVIRSFLLFLFISYATVLSVLAQATEKNKANNQLTARGEVVFTFDCNESCSIRELSQIISIDKVKDNWVRAYANQKQFEEFLKYNIAYEVITPPSLKSGIITSKTNKAFPGSWDTYPSYEEYVALMQSFASNYPNLCLLDTIGTSVDGRRLLCVKISDNVESKEAEPEFLFTSTMHGDEVTGYILLLRLIDYLLVNYDSDGYIKQLVDNIEIWINPNANPDGTYSVGNSSVSGATRFNTNGIDLNRSFPDPSDSDNLSLYGWEPETLAMMAFMTQHRFTLSANYHGGSEVMNYPWDTWERSHPDEDWLNNISQHYADSVKKYGGSSYFTDITQSGVTNGYDWYWITGGRQDFTTYYAYGREITIEVSIDKTPPETALPNYWNWNRAAMLHFIQQCQYGVHGIVSDVNTGTPLSATVFIMGHDADNSHVYADSINGDYHRLLAPGTYDMLFQKTGYNDTLVQGVVLDSYTSRIELNVAMSIGDEQLMNPIEPEIIWSSLNRVLTIKNSIYKPTFIRVVTSSGQIVFSGKAINNSDSTYTFSLPNELPHGVYICQIIYNNGTTTTVKFFTNQ